MGKIISFVFFILSLTATCFAQSNYTESLTITTYYPSPYGVYRNLKLNPTNEVPTEPALSAGVMYYDNGKDMIRYYNKTGAWVNMTGGGGGDQNVYIGTNPTCPNGKIIMRAFNGVWYTADASIPSWTKVFCGAQLSADGSGILVNEAHSALACSNAGGEVVPDGAGNNMCRFPGAICPSAGNWNPYNSWAYWPGGSCTGSGGAAASSCSIPAEWSTRGWAGSCPYIDCPWMGRGPSCSSTTCNGAPKTKIGCY